MERDEGPRQQVETAIIRNMVHTGPHCASIANIENDNIVWSQGGLVAGADTGQSGRLEHQQLLPEVSGGHSATIILENSL